MCISRASLTRSRLIQSLQHSCLVERHQFRALFRQSYCLSLYLCFSSAFAGTTQFPLLCGERGQHILSIPYVRHSAVQPDSVFADLFVPIQRDIRPPLTPHTEPQRCRPRSGPERPPIYDKYQSFYELFGSLYARHQYRVQL